MSADATAGARRGAGSRTWLRWSTGGCAANAAAWLGAMLYAAGGPQRLLGAGDAGGIGFSLVLLAWPLGPTVAMLCVVLLAHRVWHGGYRVAAAGVGALLVVTAASLLAIFGSESSTAALGFLTLPLVEAGVVLFATLFTYGNAAVLPPS